MGTEANSTEYVLSNSDFSEYNQKKTTTLNLSVNSIEQNLCLRWGWNKQIRDDKRRGLSRKKYEV